MIFPGPQILNTNPFVPTLSSSRRENVPPRRRRGEFVRSASAASGSSGGASKSSGTAMRWKATAGARRTARICPERALRCEKAPVSKNSCVEVSRLTT
eukprot:2434808-Rhodomonas_salina.3